jgi:hypothetical protein
MPTPLQRRPGAQLRPSFSRDFAGLKTLDHGVGPAITFTRASNATFFDASGTLQTASNDVARFDHDPATRASRGLLIEEARTNSVPNSQMSGAVAGSPGTVPSGWGMNTTNGALSRDSIATGTIDGFNYIDIRVTGTAAADGQFAFDPQGSNAGYVASSGQTWTGSLYAAIVAGNAPTALTVSVSERNSANSVVASSNSSLVSAGLTLARFSVTRTFTDVNTTKVTLDIRANVTNGEVVDFTLRIAAPQLEQGAFPTSYIPTTTAAATRAADSAVVTPISSFYNQAEGTLFAQLSTLTTAAGTFPYSLSIDDNTNNNRIEIYASSSSSTVTVVSSGALQSLTSFAGAIVAGVAFSAGVAFRANDLAFSTNGLASLTDASVLLPVSPDRLRIKPATNGHIRKIAYWPKRLTNTLLEQLTT